MTLDDVPGRSAYDADHEAFRETVRSFLAREGVPNVAEWEANRLVPKEFWRKAGAIGMLCPTAPEAYGGLGLDFGYNAIVDEEMNYARSEEHTSELQSLMRISYAVFCLKKKTKLLRTQQIITNNEL